MLDSFIDIFHSEIKEIAENNQDFIYFRYHDPVDATHINVNIIEEDGVNNTKFRENSHVDVIQLVKECNKDDHKSITNNTIRALDGMQIISVPGVIIPTECIICSDSGSKSASCYRVQIVNPYDDKKKKVKAINTGFPKEKGLDLQAQNTSIKVPKYPPVELSSCLGDIYEDKCDVMVENSHDARLVCPERRRGTKRKKLNDP